MSLRAPEEKGLVLAPMCTDGTDPESYCPDQDRRVEADEKRGNSLISLPSTYRSVQARFHETTSISCDSVSKWAFFNRPSEITLLCDNLLDQ